MAKHGIEKILFQTRAYLNDKKLRFTPQREEIIREIFKRDIHFDVDYLLKKINRGKSKGIVSKATIYRTLDILIELKFLKAAHLTKNKKVYEHILDHSHHDHLICMVCQKMIEFQQPEIEILQEKICKKYGFTMQDHCHEIYGKCAACQAKDTDSN
ncbi:Fur family transcriptional regulator [Candidatus Riflebacteria bacterium]